MVIDGSASINSTDFLEAKEFAKNITAAFADRNLFINGSTASYVQFSSIVYPTDTGTFFSLDNFNAFIDGNIQRRGRTNIDAGIIAAHNLLNVAPPASTAFMIVLTEGDDNNGGNNVLLTSNNARADGITLFAVGVGEILESISLENN